jgi:tetraacyldisaccharide 4'-kinase
MILPEFLYYLGYSIKKRHVFKNQKKLPHKVISIGNLTLGGTGKTPATIALAEEAREIGFKPCILTRGYRGRARGPCFVSRGERPVLDAYQAGDEALLMAEKLKGVPIVKGKDRYKAGMFALSSLSPALCPDLFILDDGFQHWGLFRDKDILLIDSSNPFGNRRLLPLGSLREPISEISRADLIVITKVPSEQQSAFSNQKSVDTPSLILPPRWPACHPSGRGGMGGGGHRQGSGVKALSEEIRQYNTRAPIFFAGHMPSKFIKANGDKIPFELTKNKRFFGFCGIGNPQSFRKTLLSADIELTGFKPFRDHYRYSQGDIQEIIRNAKGCNADWIVTTEKDIMRLKDFALPENMVSLCIEFSVDERFYEEVLGGLDGQVYKCQE